MTKSHHTRGHALILDTLYIITRNPSFISVRLVYKDLFKKSILTTGREKSQTKGDKYIHSNGQKYGAPCDDQTHSQ